MLRRHYTTCKSRKQRPVPEKLKRGKRKVACDLCAKSKLWCDFESPCETCLSKNQECTYTRLKEDSSPQNQSIDTQVPPTVPNDGLEKGFHSATPSGQGDTETVSKPSQKASLPFLLNLTNPNNSLAGVFGHSKSSSPDELEEEPPLQFQVATTGKLKSWHYFRYAN